MADETDRPVVSAPYVVAHTEGRCGGCGGRIWWSRQRWAHRRCAETLTRHRPPFITEAAPAIITLGVGALGGPRVTVADRMDPGYDPPSASLNPNATASKETT